MKTYWQKREKGDVKELRNFGSSAEKSPTVTRLGRIVKIALTWS